MIGLLTALETDENLHELDVMSYGLRDSTLEEVYFSSQCS